MRYHISLVPAFTAVLLGMAVAAPSRAQMAFPSPSDTAYAPQLAPQGQSAQVGTPSTPEDKRSIDELSVLYGNTLAWGMGFGAMVGGASRSGKPAAFFLPGLGMSALGAGAVALADSTGKPLRYGVPNSVTAGLYMGLETGIFASLIASEARPDLSGGAVAGILWGSSTAGALMGGILGDAVGTTPGRASFVQSGALWGGLISSFVTVGAMSPSAPSAPSAPYQNQTMDTGASGVTHPVMAAGISGLVGMAAGAVTTGLIGSKISPSIARVRFIDLGGLGGGLLAAGVYASAAGDNIQAQPMLLLTALGAGVGLGIGAVATSNMEPDRPRRHRKATEGWVMPTFAPTAGGATAGVVGVF